MAKRQADLDRGVERMLALSGSANDVTFKVTRGVTRPVWEADAGTMTLYEKARGVAKAMGARTSARQCRRRLRRQFYRRHGNPTLDGLGVRGADAHTLNEHIEIDSLAERGRPDGRICWRRWSGGWLCRAADGTGLADQMPAGETRSVITCTPVGAI